MACLFSDYGGSSQFVSYIICMSLRLSLQNYSHLKGKENICVFILYSFSEQIFLSVNLIFVMK